MPNMEGDLLISWPQKYCVVHQLESKWKLGSYSSKDQIIKVSASPMISPLSQTHIVGLNQMQQPIAIPNNNLQQSLGGCDGGMTNLQNAANPVVHNFSMGGLFNRPPAGMINPIQGLSAFQPGMMDVRAAGVGLGGNMGLPPPLQSSGSQ